MRNVARSLAVVLALQPAFALAQSAPANLPGQSVYGRLGVPGDTGPGQAIPLSVLSKNLTGILLAKTCSTSNWFSSLSSGGVFGCTQPSFADLTGLVAVAQLPPGVGIQSSSTVTGLSTTYTSVQAVGLINRSNSGNPMADTLPGTSPGVLPANTIITVTNADTAGVLSIKVGSGAVLKTAAASTGYVYLCPGQTTSFYTDGSNYWQINRPGRCVFKANTTIYVATTGSNSNDGVTTSTPLLDGSFAYTLLQNSFDLNSLIATISYATPGTYPQQTVAGPIVGNVVTRASNNVLIQGNPTTPANVKIADTGSTGFAAIQVYGGAAVTLNGFQITSTNNSGLIADLNSNVIYQNVDWHGVHSGLNHVISENGSRITLAGNETISSSAGCHWISGNGGNIETSGAVTPVVTLTGTPAWTSGFACTQYSGSNVVIQGSVTFSGGATGPAFKAAGGLINSGTVGCTGFPSNSSGTTGSGGVCQ